jgi:spore coat protein U-like protein
MHKFIKSAIATGALLAVGAANAATTTATFQVTATVLARCSTSAATLAFGNYNPGGGNVDQTSNVTVNCTKNTAFNVGLNAGLAPAATVTTRRMRSAGTPAEELAYSLYTTAARTINWGNTVGTDTLVGTGTGFGNALTYTVFGRVPDTAANQNALVAADYADTITVTVTY